MKNPPEGPPPSGSRDPPGHSGPISVRSSGLSQASRSGPPPGLGAGPTSTRSPPSSRLGSLAARVGLGATERIEGVLAQFLSPAVRRSVIDCGARQAKLDPDLVREADLHRLLVEVKRGVKLFVRDPAQLDRCITELNQLDQSTVPPREMVVDVRGEEDVLRARSAGREICIEQAVSDVILTKIVTAISELGRNIVRYAGTGEISVRSIVSPQRAIEIVARDRGPGITNLQEILAGKYRSKHGMGAGLRGTKALMDDFDVKTSTGQGTVITVRKYIL